MCAASLRWVSRPGGEAVFVDELKRAIAIAPRVNLPAVASVLWKAVADGHVDDVDAEELSGLIQARQLVPLVKPTTTRRGSRPRTDASLERRRRWAASGRMPPAIAARFTAGEQAALAVVAVEACKPGGCRWPLARIAAVAGISISTAKRAIREAKALGLVSVEIRKIAMWRNDTNVVSIVCRTWQAWLSRAGGVHDWPTTIKQDSRKPFLAPRIVTRAIGDRGWGRPSGYDSDCNASAGRLMPSPTFGRLK